MKRFTLTVSFFVLASQLQASELNPNWLNDTVNGIPEGFEDLFLSESGLITVDLYGERLQIHGTNRYRSVTIKKEQSSELSEFLSLNGVDKIVVNSIIESLNSGVDSSIECKGLISECALYPDSYDFSFDDASKTLRIFVNEKAISANKQNRYFNPDIPTVSLVNNTSLYASVAEKSSNAQWRNETFIAMPVGHIEADTQLSYYDTSGSDFNTYQANYVVDRENFSLEVGYDRVENVDNNASSLLTGKSAYNYHVTAFDNDRLAVRDNRNIETLSVFSQQTAELEIYRDDRLITRTTISQGVNEIPLSTFDRGAYNVSLKFIVGGKVVKEETRYVYNISSFDMNIDEYDWYAKAGQYESEIYGNHAFASVGAVSRMLPSTLLGISYENTGLKSSISGYAEHVFNEEFNTNLLLSLDFNGSYYTNAQARLDFVHVSYESLKANSDEFGSSYNNINHDQITATVPFRALDGYHTINYSYYSGDDHRYNSNSEIQSVFFNTNYDFQNFDLSGSLQFDENLRTDETSWFVGVNVSVPIGKNLDAVSNFSTDETDRSELRTTLRYHETYDDTSVYGEASVVNMDEEVISSSQLQVFHTNDHFESDARVYLETGSSINGSMNFRSTQIVGSDTLAFTNERGSAFAIIDSQNRDSQAIVNSKNKSYGHLEMRDRSNGQIKVTRLYENDETIKLNEYSQYDFELNSENSQFVAIGDTTYTHFAKPGTFIKAKNDVALLNKYIVAFADEGGREITTLECAGDGCNEIEEVAMGVYKVSVYEDFDFTLYSEKNYCFIQSAESSEQVINLGKSICISESTLAKLIKEVPESHALYYLGSVRAVQEHKDSNVTYIKYGDNYAKFGYQEGTSSQAIAGIHINPRLVKVTKDKTHGLTSKVE